MILKAWLDEKTALTPLLTSRKPKRPFRNAPASDCPVVISTTTAAGELTPDTDADAITVESDLNKIACTVATGRSMGGVHWRSDNSR